MLLDRLPLETLRAMLDAAMIAGRVAVLDWTPRLTLPARRESRTFPFAGPLLARKGSHAMREVVAQPGIELMVQHRDIKHPKGWAGLPVRPVPVGDLPAALAGVVPPVLVEQDPHTVPRALAACIPVIAPAAFPRSPA